MWIPTPKSKPFGELPFWKINIPKVVCNQHLGYQLTKSLLTVKETKITVCNIFCTLYFTNKLQKLMLTLPHFTNLLPTQLPVYQPAYLPTYLPAYLPACLPACDKFLQGPLKGEVSLYCWPPVWLVWNQLYDHWQFLCLFAKQANTNRSNRRSSVKFYFPPLAFPGSCNTCSTRNTKGRSITVLLTFCLTGLESAVWPLTIFVFICKTD